MAHETVQEIALTFKCGADRLIGITHLPEAPLQCGLLIVVGGPQYRVGSHRQFLLLARDLASQDVPVMRFDFRGMGDSEGDPRKFDDIDEDIRAAVDAFFRQVPDLKNVVIWGLCDAASAALFYGYQDPRVCGLVLLNPWVYTEKGAATVLVKTYYLQRLFSADLWRKIARMDFKFAEALSSLYSNLRNAFGNFAFLKEKIDPFSRKIQLFLQQDRSTNTLSETAGFDIDAGSAAFAEMAKQLPLPDRMRLCLERFQHPVLFILSGNDLTAGEFKEVVNSSPQWRKLLSEPRITRRNSKEADHTFSTRKWRDQVAAWTLEWVKSCSVAKQLMQPNEIN